MSSTHKLYPAVAVHGPGESIRINFGQKPFKFDLRNFEEEEFNREKRRVSEIRINETLAQQVRMMKALCCHTLVVAAA